MNPALKAKWLAALRSGKYKQSQDFLRTRDDEFCCLGVLCDVAGEEWTVRDEVRYETKSGRHTTLLQQAQLQAYELSAYQQSVLIGLNTNLDFPAIANHIEANL